MDVGKQPVSQYSETLPRISSIGGGVSAQTDIFSPILLSEKRSQRQHKGKKRRRGGGGGGGEQEKGRGKLTKQAVPADYSQAPTQWYSASSHE